MKNEEIVRALREHAEWARANEWETPITLSDDLAAAADLIEKLTARCARYAEEIAVAQERTRWIPVTERLPEANEFEEAGGMSKVVLGIAKNDSGFSLFNPCLCVPERWAVDFSWEAGNSYPLDAAAGTAEGGGVMLELRLDDPHFVENFQAALNLKKMGFADDELELLYQKQLEEDAKEVAND